MDRDRRLTGYLRGQVDQPTAPAGFEVSNGWRVSYDTLRQETESEDSTNEFAIGREAHHLNTFPHTCETDDSTACAEFSF